MYKYIENILIQLFGAIITIKYYKDIKNIVTTDK